MQMVGQFSPYKNTVFEYFLTNYFSLKNRKRINIGRTHRSQQSLWTSAVEDRSRVESLAMLISPLPPLCVVESIFSFFSFFSFFISPLLYPVRAGERDYDEPDNDDNGNDVEEEENNEDLDEH